MVSPFPTVNLGPFGSLPSSELPARPPKKSHKCESCPGGALVDNRKLTERDPIARCFADCCFRFRDPADPLASSLCDTEWDRFVRQLHDRELIDDADLHFFNVSPFGTSSEVTDGKLTFSGFQCWICQKRYGEELRDFDSAAEAMRGALHSVNISIGHRGLGTLSQRELYTYQVLLSEYEHAVADNLYNTLQQLKSTESEWEKKELDEILKSSVGHDPGSAFTGHEEAGPLPTTPEEYQWVRGPQIEKRLLEVRVANVIFPRRERLLLRTDWGMRRLIATAPISGDEVEVIELPWDLPHSDDPLANSVSDCMEGLKQLALSRYFLDYRGFDFTSYSGVGLHFISHWRGVSLRKMVKISGPLSDSHPLFVYWAREILLGLRDYLHQCCQEITEDLTLEHVFVQHEGLNLYFKNVPFGGRRGIIYEDIPDYGPQNKWRNGFVAVENRLLTMFGNMLLELLYGEQEFHSPIRTLQDLSRGWQAIISLSINCRDTLDVFMLGGLAQSGAITEAPQSLAGGFVGAGIDMFNSGEAYKLWWLAESDDPVTILPNTERSADEGRADFLQDWCGGGDALYVPVTEQKQKVPEVQWKPNAHLFTIQAMLNHPDLQRREDDVKQVIEAWSPYYERYQANHAEVGRLEKFLDGKLT